MDLRDFSNMGHQFKDIVSDAVDSMNYQKLNHDINKAFTDMFDSVKPKNKGFHYNPKDDQGRPIYTNHTNYSGNTYTSSDYYTSKANSNKTGSQSYAYGNSTSGRTYSTHTGTPVSYSSSVYDVGFPVLKNPTGRISSILLMTLGYTFGTIFGITELVLLICGLAIDAASSALFITAAGLSPLLAASIICAMIGSKKHGRLKRYKAYLKALKGKTFASFKELTGAIGKGTAYIQKDMRWFIDNGYFPQGHIDKQKTCIMLTDDIYKQYMETQTNYENRKLENLSTDTGKTSTLSDSENEALNKIAEDGKRYMARIREANDAIPDTDISNKLYRMELIVEKIFDYAKQNPDQIPSLRRFMEYYMPTTDKLVNAYKEFDRQPIQGENIKNAKAEISKALDTINLAYEKLYDSMYVEAAMDVSSDISVLQTLLAQEGLTQSAFEKKE